MDKGECNIMNLLLTFSPILLTLEFWLVSMIIWNEYYLLN